MNVFAIVFGRIVGRIIGLHTRYFFFRLIGKEISYDDLKTPVINKDNDYDGKGLQQDMYNVLVGSLVFLIIVTILFFSGA